MLGWAEMWYNSSLSPQSGNHSFSRGLWSSSTKTTGLQNRRFTSRGSQRHVDPPEGDDKVHTESSTGSTKSDEVLCG